MDILSDYPEWLGATILDDDLPWDKFKTISLGEFLEKITLHDSSLVKIILDGPSPNSALIIIQLDSHWMPPGIIEKSCLVEDWPYLFITIDEIDNIDFQGHIDDYCTDTIGMSNWNENEASYEFVIDDVMNGQTRITYIGETKILLLNKHKQVLELL